MKDVKMSDDGMDGLCVSVVVKVQTRLLQAIYEWERFAVRKGRSGSVGWCDRPCEFESVELERGWIVGGVNRHFLVADIDAHRSGRMLLQK